MGKGISSVAEPVLCGFQFGHLFATNVKSLGWAKLLFLTPVGSSARQNG